MIASNENKSIYIARTPCGRMLFMKIGGVGLWLAEDDFMSLAVVVRQALDSMMDGFLSGIADNRLSNPEQKDGADNSVDGRDET